MAGITLNGTKNLLPASQLPAGYTKPNVTTFADSEWPRTFTLEVDKATVDNAVAATTMANIINDAAIGLDKQLSDILIADFSALPTVTAYAEWTVLRTNYSDMDSAADYLKTTLAKYVCTVKLYVKSV